MKIMLAVKRLIFSLFIGGDGIAVYPLSKELNLNYKIQNIWIGTYDAEYARSSMADAISTFHIPSIWEEGFRTIIVHALLNGIPVTANRRRGFEEAVEMGGITLDDYMNLVSWVKTIKDFYINTQLCSNLVDETMKHATKFNYHDSLEQMVILLCRKGGTAIM